ncbi:hypothetical protein HPP92_001072 [Vanilla planifolia]|uniref:Pentatricopeptide repeat-containing protein n=1 Tax=Vanilla planifolia TaxID=51239 RepID=A0A835RXI1_VANPL|nr:hypothetical protein HPP92_001072 [Vanilla planifolia]
MNSELHDHGPPTVRRPSPFLRWEEMDLPREADSSDSVEVWPSFVHLLWQLSTQMYTRCGPDLSDARRLFGEMPHRNCFSWNSLLDACLNSSDSAASLRLFSLMPHKNEYSWNAIITGLVRLGNIGEARKIFDKMPVKNAIALNSIIHGYFGSGNAHEALDVYKRLSSVLMGTWTLCLDKFVLATLISFCADQRSLRLGKQIHSLIVVSQVEMDPVLNSSIIDMYGKCGDLHTACKYLKVTAEPDEFSLSALITAFVSSGRFVEARRLFARREDPGVVLWNSIINGYASNGAGEEALGLFIQMRRRGVDPDKSTFASVLSVCAGTGVVVNAKQIHALVLKQGILEDIIVASALMDSYSKAGNWDDACSVFRMMQVHDTILLNSLINVCSSSGKITEARKVFDNIPEKTIISWNSMIVGYSQNGLSVKAIELFIEMHRRDIGIDKVTMASIISASASLCSLSIGEQVYALAIVYGLESDQIIATSLVDLYCKCGFIAEGRRVFDVMVKADEAP